MVIAHRGFSAQYPENTMLAFQKAVDQKVDVIELDVRASREDIPIILHDATLDRTTNATGSPNDYSLEELRCINASHWRGGQTDGYRTTQPAYPRMPIPSLEEVLHKLAHQVCFDLHVHETQPAFLDRISRLYDEFDLYEQAIVSVRSFRQAEQIRKINPYVELCVREWRGSEEREVVSAWRDFGCRYASLRTAEVTPKLHEALRDFGIHVSVGAVNDRPAVSELLRAGVRGIVTDHPDMATSVAQALGLE